MAQYAIAKVDDEKRTVFGWAYQCVDKHGNRVVDHSGEFIEPADLEDAMYGFVKESRESNDMHNGPVTGVLIESMVFTKDKLEALGLPGDALPQGAWVGFQLDPESYAKVKTGERTAWSIEGVAEKVAA